MTEPDPLTPTIVLKANLPGSHPHELGPEIWQESREEAFRHEAECYAEHAPTEVLGSLGREQLVEQLTAEMSAALQGIGDTYRAPDGVLYALVDSRSLAIENTANLGPVGVTVLEVLRFEDLPVGSRAARRAVVRWSDGSESEAIRFYRDEILFCEGDLVGQTREQIRGLLFRRDRDWLQDQRENA